MRVRIICYTFISYLAPTLVCKNTQEHVGIVWQPLALYAKETMNNYNINTCTCYLNHTNIAHNCLCAAKSTIIIPLAYEKSPLVMV